MEHRLGSLKVAAEGGGREGKCSWPSRENGREQKERKGKKRGKKRKGKKKMSYSGENLEFIARHVFHKIFGFNS